MKACLSQVTTLPASFADDLATAAGAGFRFVEVWLTKLERHLEAHSLDATANAIADAGLAFAAASVQGGLLVGSAEQRAAHLDHFKRRLDLCQSLGIPTIVLAPGFARREEIEVAAKHLVEAARWAAGFGVRLALEFHAADAFCNNLDTAATLIEACAEPNLGLCLDAFHFHTGPSKTEDLARLTAKNLFHVQFCDTTGRPRELLADADRVLPGDGEINLASLADRFRAIGYAGAVSVEMMNPMLWTVSAEQVAEAARQSLERFGVAP